MQLSWGNFFFAANAAEITNTTVTARSEWSGLPVRYDTEWSVKAYLDGASQDLIFLTEKVCRAALAVPYQNFIFTGNDGSQSPLTLLNSQTMSGLRVKDISVKEADGKEYTTTRTISFTVFGSYSIANINNAIISYKETMTAIGDGSPDLVWRFPVNATPGVLQQITPCSLATMVQSGYAVGHTVRPLPAPPQFPIFEMRKYRKSTTISPKWLGKAFIDLYQGWEYRFERGDGFGFVGVPIIPAPYLNLST